MMLSSPMSHYFRHVLMSYSDVSGIQKKRILKQKLNLLESQLLKLRNEQPRHQKVNALLEHIRSVKARL